MLGEQSHSPGRNLVHCSYNLDAALGHSRASLMRLEKLAHRPADIGLGCALKLLLRRKVQIDLVKSRKHVLEQQVDARRLLRALEFYRKRRLYGAAAFVSE